MRLTAYWKVLCLLSRQNLPKILSITQLTGVADTLVHEHTPMPCRSSMTFFIIGSCTYGGFGTLMLDVPSLVTSRIGS